MNGKVFNIQRFSLNDGPGIRTTVFLKGCSLRCKWCHNPEGLSPASQLQFLNGRCIACRKCEKCKRHVHDFANGHRLNLQMCNLCGECVQDCPSQALTIVGKDCSPQELSDELLKDIDFFGDQGGVTFSGGEPLLQSTFVDQTAALLKQNGVKSVAVDTAGNVEWLAFETVMQNIDLFLYDVKAYSPQRHVVGTGRDNKQIIDNLLRLNDCSKNIWIRVPLIGGFNDSEMEIKSIADFVNGLTSVSRVTLIPFHRLGEEKYRSVGLISNMSDYYCVDEERTSKFRQYFNK